MSSLRCRSSRHGQPGRNRGSRDADRALERFLLLDFDRGRRVVLAPTTSELAAVSVVPAGCHVHGVQAYMLPRLFGARGRGVRA